MYELDRIDISELCDFEIYFSDAVKLSKYGRLSGGVYVFIRKSLLKFCLRLPVDIDNTVCIRLDKHLTGTERDVLLFAVYVPPEGSSYYKVTGKSVFFEQLEQWLLENAHYATDCHILLCGDFNARVGTGNQPPDIRKENFDNFCPDDQSVPADSRSTCDTCVNRFGKLLLDFCYVFDLYILNGRMAGDKDGMFTYISEQGSSLIDYFISSPGLFQYFSHFRVGNRIESKHMPLNLNFTVSGETKYNAVHSETTYRYRWNNEYAGDFMDKITLSSSKFDHLINVLETDIDLAIESFVNCILDAAECMKMKVDNISKSFTFYGPECHRAKREAKRSLRMFRKNK